MLQGSIKIDIAALPSDSDEDVDCDPIMHGIEMQADDFCPAPENATSNTKVFTCHRPDFELTVTVIVAQDGSVTLQSSRSMDVAENTLCFSKGAC